METLGKYAIDWSYTHLCVHICVYTEPMPSAKGTPSCSCNALQTFGPKALAKKQIRNLNKKLK